MIKSRFEGITQANMTEWSKVLRSGRSVFARVGSNPTVCIFLFSIPYQPAMSLSCVTVLLRTLFYKVSTFNSLYILLSHFLCVSYMNGYSGQKTEHIKGTAGILLKDHMKEANENRRQLP